MDIGDHAATGAQLLAGLPVLVRGGARVATLMATREGQAILRTLVRGTVREMGEALVESGQKMIRPFRSQMLQTEKVLGEIAAANRAPYGPRAMEDLLRQRYGAAVESSTLPASNAKNVRLAGSAHPESKIVFDNRGFPIFDDVAIWDTRISRNAAGVKDPLLHMEEATSSLRDGILRNPSRAEMFNGQQLEAIMNGESKIPGFTWHHHQDFSRMQLIPENIHNATGHVGGMFMWFR